MVELEAMYKRSNRVPAGHTLRSAPQSFGTVSLELIFPLAQCGENINFACITRCMVLHGLHDCWNSGS
jgi:hypothetical protein